MAKRYNLGANHSKMIKKIYNNNVKLKELGASAKHLFTGKDVKSKNSYDRIIRKQTKALYNLRQEKDIKEGNIEGAKKRAIKNPNLITRRDKNIIKGKSNKAYVTELGYKIGASDVEQYNKNLKALNKKRKNALAYAKKTGNKEMLDFLQGKNISVQGFGSTTGRSLVELPSNLPYIENRREFKREMEFMEKELSIKGGYAKYYSKATLLRNEDFFNSFLKNPSFTQLVNKMSPIACSIFEDRLNYWFAVFEYQSDGDTSLSDKEIEDRVQAMSREMERIQSQVDKKYKKTKPTKLK